MLSRQIQERLRDMDQLHLAAKLHLLSEEEQKQFLKHLDPDFLQLQSTLSKQTLPPSFEEPAKTADEAHEKWKSPGNLALQQGKCASLILAGGQGSRLGSSLPKALVPLNDEGVTLLQIHLEKLYHLSHEFHITVPCAITTSQSHYPWIMNYLETHHFFHLVRESITVIVQEEAPLLNGEGNWFLRENGMLALAPNGNGSSLKLLEEKGVLAKWESLGISALSIIPIDNLLANPIDPILLGYHTHHALDVTLKVITREHPDEKMGVIVLKDQKIQVQEYSELPLEARNHTYFAHIGLLTLSLSFARKVSKASLPWHFCLKKDPFTEGMVGKFEQFLFDILPSSEKTSLLLYPRKEVYAPLKNKTGEHGLDSVQQLLSHLKETKIF
ncbi:MAG: UTP--glucose-1-phosphate uridylyltransferase [Candidatus Rhabdochlamydia sp.]